METATYCKVVKKVIVKKFVKNTKSYKYVQKLTTTKVLVPVMNYNDW